MFQDVQLVTMLAATMLAATIRCRYLQCINWGEAGDGSAGEDWLKKFGVELLQQSPQLPLRYCSALANQYQPLAKEVGPTGGSQPKRVPCQSWKIRGRLKSKYV